MKLSLIDILLAIICFIAVACLLLLKHIYPENQFIIKYLSGAPQFFIILTFVLALFLADKFFRKKGKGKGNG